MNINLIFQFTLFVLRKNQAGGLSGAEFSLAWNDEQTSFMRDLTGRFNKQNNTKEGANTGLIQNDTILTILEPFTKNSTLTVDSSGIATKPADFYYKLALRSGNYMITQIKKNSIARMLNDPINPPNMDDNEFYYTSYGKNYQIYPSSVSEISLDYISIPTPVKWSSTPDGDQMPVYDPNTSVDPQWDDISCQEITRRMFRALGVSFQDQDFQQFGNISKATGE